MGNELQVLIDKSGLEKTKAQVLLENFRDFFDVAAEWERRAKTIVVTSEEQSAEMKIARIGRLELREKRISIENKRKELKEQSLREGKAIDGIANALKAVIVPIEEYLERQEKFVEFKKQAEQEARRAEIERRIEEERIAKEKADAEERERVRQENEKLKAEAEAREKQIAEERKKAEKQRLEAEARAKAERDAVEAKARKEREEAERKLEAERAQARAERQAAEKKAIEERARIEGEKRRAEEERKKVEKQKAALEKQLLKMVECPKCKHKFSIQ